MKNNIINNIRNCIAHSKYKTAFTVFDFRHLANYETVRKSIARLAHDGFIKRISRGIFYKPVYSAKLDMWSLPKIDDIAYAIARERGRQICISGQRALNYVHASAQIPNVYEYAWTGPTTTMYINNIKVIFRKCKDKDFTHDALTNLVIQSLKQIGKDNINNKIIQKYKNDLSSKQKETILEYANTSTQWIKKATTEICKKEETK